MKKIITNQGLVIVIIVIAIVLRFYQLGVVPASLNEDETALGYNAYSLLKTGTDEHGAFMPLSLKSFGDWKLPLYPLITVPSIALFDLTEFAVRLPSAIAGVLGVVLVILICQKLFTEKKVGLFAGLFYALSPWNIYFSRMAYEANVATTLLLGAVYVFLLGTAEKKQQRLLPVSALLFGLTVFTYHAFVIFTPLFVFALAFFWRKQLHNRMGWISAIVFLLFVGFAFISSLQGSVGKLSDFSIFNDKNIIYNRGEIIRGDTAKDPGFIKHVLYNKYFAVGYQIGQNYIASFSPTFLFDKGGEKLVHTLGVFGNLYLFDALLLVIGLCFLLWKKEKAILLLFIWLILSPIPSSITRDAPNAARLVMILPGLLIIAGYGAACCVDILNKYKPFNYGVLFVLSMVYLLNVTYFADIYFFHIDIMRGKYLHYGYKQMVELTNKYPDKKVVVRGPENFPYISFLFYNKYDSQKFQKEVVYYPNTGGFEYVKSFDRYSFVDDIDYNHLERNTIYITDHITDNNPNLIKLPSGEAQFLYTITDEKTTH